MIRLLPGLSHYFSLKASFAYSYWKCSFLVFLGTVLEKKTQEAKEKSKTINMLKLSELSSCEGHKRRFYLRVLRPHFFFPEKFWLSSKLYNLQPCKFWDEKHRIKTVEFCRSTDCFEALMDWWIPKSVPIICYSLSWAT